jgi:glycyl-radical enzyme activating protein
LWNWKRTCSRKCFPALCTDMAMQTGLVTDIQRFSVDDGPGIRTTVFLKGCPLRCKWCHNPECLSPGVQLRYMESACVRCGACEKVCPKKAHRVTEEHHQVYFEKCIACGACVEACAYDALSLSGKTVTVEEVLSDVMKDKRYYDTSGGGITVSGGEPMMQQEFTLALLAAAKEQNIHTCLETCGCVDENALKEAVRLTDVFLYDYKATDPLVHQALTGAGNQCILHNLDMLYHLGATIILRCPIIPGCNMEAAHFDGIIALLMKYPKIPRAELMAYHKMGLAKYRQLGKLYALSDLPDMSPEKKAETLAYFHTHTKRTVIFS